MKFLILFVVLNAGVAQAGTCELKEVFSVTSLSQGTGRSARITIQEVSTFAECEAAAKALLGNVAHGGFKFTKLRISKSPVRRYSRIDPNAKFLTTKVVATYRNDEGTERVKAKYFVNGSEPDKNPEDSTPSQPSGQEDDGSENGHIP